MLKRDICLKPCSARALAILFIILICWQPGCNKTGSRPANIIMISIDTLRADHVGVYGYKRETTPTMDQLAKTGIFFTQAHTTAPWTLPAHMSLMTGLPPSLHGVEMDNQKLSPKIKTMPEYLKAKGYATAGLVTLPYTMAKYGFSRGFDLFEEHLKEPADVVTDRALDWLGNTRNKNFFLFLHYCDVHWPYHPPEKYARLFQLNPQAEGWDYMGYYIFLRKFIDTKKEMPAKIHSIVTRLYDAEIRSVDHQIKRVYSYLQKNQMTENTVILITSDHGEEFNEHKSFGHGHSFYAELTRIPLILYNPPRIKPGVKIEEPVSLLDIPFTLLRLAGIKPDHQFTDHAVDLSDYFKGTRGPANSRRKIFIETTWAGPKRIAIIQNQRKYFHRSRFHTPGKKRRWVFIPAGMFDIIRDQGDRQNLLNRLGQGSQESQQKVRLISSLNQYAVEHSQGLRLIFKNSNHTMKSPLSIQATLSFDRPLMGHPFSFNTKESDQVVMDQKKRTVDINLHLDGQIKIIFFPTSRSHQKMGLKFQHNGVTIFHQYRNIPRDSSPIELFADRSLGIALEWQGTIGNPTFYKEKLSNQEIKALKSLGYINETP